MSYVFRPIEQNQGVGARVIRVIGGDHLKRLDPFLMLDHARVRLPAGFPDHPHRGFQTVSYMIQGTFHHEDFKGHKGIIGPGGVQWMSAGKGIVHAEMPGSFDQDSVGFQLWLNLKSSDKMKQPNYQEYSKQKIPVWQDEKSKVKIISGKWKDHVGPIQYTTPTYYMDIHLPKNGQFQIPIQKGWNSIIYVYQGTAQYNSGVSHIVKQKEGCLLEKSTQKQLVHNIRSGTGAKFLLLSGQPINQPIASYGPFVMNTQAQIQKTFEDYEKCINGFQSRKGWQSQVRNMSKEKNHKNKHEN